MGWTSYSVNKYAFNRKEECDRLWTCTHSNGVTLKVLKSSMVGTTYYAAVEVLHPSGERNVFGAVCLTSLKDGEFYYKDMDESCGPAESQCPLTILKLLTPTDSKYAQDWRARCYAYAEQSKAKRTQLSSIPFGAKVRAEVYGKEMILVKCPPAYQFKTWFWADGGCHYVKKNAVKVLEVLN